MSNKRTGRHGCWLAALVLVVAPAQAQIKDLQWHGFASQGYVLSDGNNVNGESSEDSGSLDFRELGANVSARPWGRLLLSAQVASVQQGEVTEEDLILDFAVADIIVSQTQLGRFGLRLGKLKLPFGLFNDARDAVFTRPGILLPQSIYLDTDGARAFGYFSSKGVALYGDAYFGRHNLQADLGLYGDETLGETAAISILRRPASGRFSMERSLVLRVGDELDGGRWRVMLTASSSDLRYRPGDDPPFLMAGNFEFSQFLLSLQHNRERLSLTSEIVRRTIKLDDLIPGPGDSTTDQDSLGFYLQATWRWTDQLSLALRYDERQRELQDRRGHRQSARSEQSGNPLPRHYFFARDTSFGARYQFTPALELWAELHVIDGVAWVNPLDNPGFHSGNAERHWSLFTAMLAYRF